MIQFVCTLINDLTDLLGILKTPGVLERDEFNPSPILLGAPPKKKNLSHFVAHCVHPLLTDWSRVPNMLTLYLTACEELVSACL